MYQPDRNRSPSTSQFAVRVAVLGGIALAMFSIIFLRLWYLQVLSGDRYLTEAENNQVREIKVQAPRGEILDRDGNVLVDNRTALALQIATQDLPAERDQRKRVLKRVADVTGKSLKDIRTEIRQQTKELPASPVTIERDVAYPVVYYLQEHQPELPGVSVQRVFVRHYPQGDPGRAHLRLRQRGQRRPALGAALPGPRPGRPGRPDRARVRVRPPAARTGRADHGPGRRAGPPARAAAQLPGARSRATTSARRSTPGSRQAGESALSQFGGLPGAFVAMDVSDGSILGLGSYPTFDPSIFTRPTLPPALYKRLSSEKTGAPLSDRAIQGLYPTGSTFKPITAVGGARGRPDHARRARRPTPDRSRSAGSSSRTPAGRSTGRSRCPPRSRSPRTSTSTSSASRPTTTSRSRSRPGPQNLGIGSPTGIDLPAEGGDSFRRPSGATSSTSRATPTGRGRWATTSTWRSARATCRRTRCRWRSPTRRSPTAATSCDRTSRRASRTRAGRVVQEFDPAPRGHVDIAPQYSAADPRRPARRPRWSPAAPRIRSSAASRSTSPARPGRRSAGSTRRTSRGMSRSPHTLTPRSSSRSRSSTAASAPTPRRRRPPRSSPPTSSVPTRRATARRRSPPWPRPGPAEGLRLSRWPPLEPQPGPALRARRRARGRSRTSPQRRRAHRDRLPRPAARSRRSG